MRSMAYLLWGFPLTSNKSLPSFYVSLFLNSLINKSKNSKGGGNFPSSIRRLCQDSLRFSVTLLLPFHILSVGKTNLFLHPWMASLLVLLMRWWNEVSDGCREMCCYERHSRQIICIWGNGAAAPATFPSLHPNSVSQGLRVALAPEAMWSS